MLQQELSFFIEHQADLITQYLGKVLVIKNQEVIGVYRSPIEAYLEAQRQHDLGTFLIQPCEAGPQAYTVTITSQEIFA